MNKTTLTAVTGDRLSLQITHLADITQSATAFEPGYPFLVKVRGDGISSIQVLPIGQDNYVTTSLASGWNVELLKGIKYTSDITSNIQIGY